MPLGVPDRLVGEVGDAALEGLGVEEAHGFLVAGLAGQALAGPEGDREDLQPQLVDQVVLDQRAYELKAAGDDDVPVYVLLQRRDLVKHVALEDCRVVPGGMFEGRGHHVLGQAVQPVRQLAAAGWPPRGEPLVAAPAQQEGPGGQRLVERELGELRAISDQADPAAGPEAFVTGRVLDDSVERDVLAHDDLSHFGSAPRWSSGNQTLAARPAGPPCLAEQPVSFAGRPVRPPGGVYTGWKRHVMRKEGAQDGDSRSALTGTGWRWRGVPGADRAAPAGAAGALLPDARLLRRRRGRRPGDDAGRLARHRRVH